MLMQAVAGLTTAVAAADGESCAPETFPSAQEAAPTLAAAPPTGPQKVPNVCGLPDLCGYPPMHPTRIRLFRSLWLYSLTYLFCLQSLSSHDSQLRIIQLAANRVK